MSIMIYGGNDFYRARVEYMSYYERRGYVMDEMNLNLGSRWMRKLASKLIVRYLKKQFEVNTELDLDELKISYVDGDVVIKTELELRMNAKESKKILSKLEEM